MHRYLAIRIACRVLAAGPGRAIGERQKQAHGRQVAGVAEFGEFFDRMPTVDDLAKRVGHFFCVLAVSLWVAVVAFQPGVFGVRHVDSLKLRKELLLIALNSAFQREDVWHRLAGHQALAAKFRNGGTDCVNVTGRDCEWRVGVFRLFQPGGRIE